jgi:hypothetical protein
MSDNYKKNADKVSKLATMPPEALIDHLAQTHENLNNVAPNIAPHIQNIAIKGINYLHQEMPKPVAEFPGQDPFEPSKGQKADWLDKYNTVNDPISILDHVRHGTLTTNHMAALQAVHPELLDHMRQKVMEEANPKAMKSLHYSTKMGLSKFLGKAMDASFVPQAIMADQMNYNMPAQQAAGAPKGKGKESTLGGLRELSLAKRAQTETQVDESAGNRK